MGAQSAGNLDEWPTELLRLRASSKEYAQNGRDIVHPGPTGHQLLAAATSLLLITRLHAARNCTNSFVPLKTARGAARSRGSTAEQEFSDAEPARDAEERCFPSADLLPTEQPLHGTWALRDEGARKGVRKVGLVSEQAGDKLVLRIPSLANGTSCQGRVVGLGYLASTHTCARRDQCVVCRLWMLSDRWQIHEPGRIPVPRGEHAPAGGQLWSRQRIHYRHNLVHSHADAGHPMPGGGGTQSSTPSVGWRSTAEPHTR